MIFKLCQGSFFKILNFWIFLFSIFRNVCIHYELDTNKTLFWLGYRQGMKLNKTDFINTPFFVRVLQRKFITN